MLKKMWYPNGIFISSKSASVHKSPIENVYFMIYKEGGVWFNYRIKLTGPCKKNFKRFPLDYMQCLLAYESNNYNADNVHFIWKPEMPLYIMKEVRLPDYDLVNTSLHRLVKVRFL